LATKWDDESFRPYREAFPLEYQTTPQTFEDHVRDLMSKDLKIPYLKSLQGYLWLTGYEAGDLRCPLFPDVAPAMRKWHDDSITIIIYSSGSVPAQRLLFQYTNSEPAADLRPLVSDYFDTVSAGLKTEHASYSKIAATRAPLPASQLLFLSDNVREVEAARVAGMQAVVVVRAGNAPLSSEEMAGNVVIHSFDEVKLV
jgi:enolase-phosphatase E1